MQCLRSNSLMSRTLSAITKLKSSTTRTFCEERRGKEQCVNEVTLLGRVGSQPTTRGTEERPVVAFSLATNSYYKDERRTSWHRVAVFKPSLADLMKKYLSKGSRVLVKGSILYGEYEGNDGIKRYTTTIVADNIIFADSRRAAEESASDTEIEVDDEASSR